MSSNQPFYINFLFYLQKRNYGKVLDSAKIWALSPRMYLCVAWLFGTLETKTNLPAPLRSMIIVRVSQLNECAFCIALNSGVMLKRGVPENKLEDLCRWPTSLLFDEREKAILRYVEGVFGTQGPLDQRLRNEIREYFDEKTVVEITALIAFQIMSTKFNNAFDLSVDTTP